MPVVRDIVHRLLAPAVMRFSRRHPRIFMYHRFANEDTHRAWSVRSLERQLKALVKDCIVLPLSEAIEVWADDSPVDKPVSVITVDDGYLDFYEVAWPLFRKYKIRPTVFVTTRFIGGEAWLWPDAIRYLTESAPDGVFKAHDLTDELTVDLSNADSRRHAWDSLCDRLLFAKTSQREYLIRNLQETLAVRLPKSPTAKFAPMTWDQIRDLDEAGVEIGAHSRTHASLSCLDHDELIDEIRGSRSDIKSRLGVAPKCFAYPNGAIEDHTEIVESAVRAAGFRCAVVAYPRVNSREKLFTLGRWSGTIDDDGFERVVTGASLVALFGRKMLGLRT